MNLTNYCNNIITDFEISEKYFEDIWLKYIKQPVIVHNDPAIYRLSKEDVEVMRNKYRKQKIKEMEKRLEFYESKLERLNERYVKETKEKWRKDLHWSIIECQNQIDRLSFSLNRKTEYANNKDIEEIRAYPIKELLNLYNLRTERSGPSREKMCCPLHKEENPSLVIYLNTNSWSCFGCGKGGGVIDFVRYYEDITVPAAIKKLSQLSTL